MITKDKRLNQLRNRVLSEGTSPSEKEIENPDMLIEIHHALMKEYGWIPLEEFKQLPIPTLWNLLACIKKQHEAEENQMRKAKHKR